MPTLKPCACHPDVNVGTGEACLNCKLLPEQHNPERYCRNSSRQDDWYNHRKEAIKILNFMSKPTLNPDYNSVLDYWVREGYSGNPKCEECGCDLTGKQVYETSIAWLCQDCKNKDQEDFHADG